MKATHIGGMVLAVVLVAGLVAVRMQRVREKEHAPTLAPAPVVVTVARVQTGQVQDARRYLGEVAALEEAPLASRIVSQVVRVAVREGDVVHRGQTVVELDPRELEDAVATAEGAVAAASEGVAAAEQGYTTERDATARDQVLMDARAIAREQWERSQASLAVSRARLESARSQLTAGRRALDSAQTRRGYAVIQAPFDGLVSARTVSPGDLAAPGKPLVTVVNTTRLSVRVKVPAEDAAAIAVGATVRIQLGGAWQPIRVSRVFPAMDAARLATFEADLSGSRLRPGSTVSVEVPLSTVSGLLLPADAILESAQARVVFVIAGGKARLVPVRVVAHDAAGHAVVTGALREGDMVVVGRPSRLMMLTDGATVQVGRIGADR
jgi:RND family efflux transporter MFP subunit